MILIMTHLRFLLNCEFFFYLFCFQDRVFLCNPDCPGTSSVDQAGLKLRDSPASASQVLGLKACARIVNSNVNVSF